MKHGIYVVHDAKAEAYMTPFFMGNDATAIRGFSDAVNNPETPFGKHTSDYTLFCIGEYSDQSGTIEPITPRPVGNGVDFKRNIENES